jgi:hypothetical protein
MNITEYLLPEDIDSVYTKYYSAIVNEHALEQQLLQIETQKQTLWQKLSTTPDFKPGKSNLEQDAKLRDYNPGFMLLHDELKGKLEEAKLQSQLAKLRVESAKTVISYFEVLTEE